MDCNAHVILHEVLSLHITKFLISESYGMPSYINTHPVVKSGASMCTSKGKLSSNNNIRLLMVAFQLVKCLMHLIK